LPAQRAACLITSQGVYTRSWGFYDFFIKKATVISKSAAFSCTITLIPHFPLRFFFPRDLSHPLTDKGLTSEKQEELNVEKSISPK